MIATASTRDPLAALIDAEALRQFCVLRTIEAGLNIPDTPHSLRIAELAALNDKNIARANRLQDTNTELVAALNGLFEHCSMIHKHWGEGDNTKQADAAQTAARAAIGTFTDKPWRIPNH